MSRNKQLVISGYHITEILKHKIGDISISLDLGLTYSTVIKYETEIVFQDGQRIELKQLEKINKRRRPEDCFLVEGGNLTFIYSFENNRVYKLYEPHIDRSPTLWINGNMMHAVSYSNPVEEARNKVSALGNIYGNVIDTCFGLGYTAIDLARSGAKKVCTYEISPSVIEIAHINPWSRNAFENKKIELANSDIRSAIKYLEADEFDLMLHDPPNLKMEGTLYSADFYTELFRVLKKGGSLYHFVGGGRVPREYKIDYLKGVTSRLYKAGFKNVRKSYRGVIATK